jgi:hypothetical protein
MLRKYKSSISRSNPADTASWQPQIRAILHRGESPTNKRGWVATPIDLGEVTDDLDVLSQVRR